MVRLSLLAAVLGLLIAGCAGPPEELSVVEKSLKSQANVSTSGLPEFGPSGGGQAASTLYWVEGKIKNSGTETFRNVIVRFRFKEGGGNKVFTAEIPEVPAGKTVAFKTGTMSTYSRVVLPPDPPEIELK